MTFSINNEYDLLYNTWLKETTSEELQPLSLNFLLELEEKLKQTLIDFSDENQIEYMIVDRIKFMIDAILLIRKKKIMKCIFDKKTVNSALLTNSEKFFYQIFSNLEILLRSTSYEKISQDILYQITSISNSDTIKTKILNIKSEKNSSLLRVRTLKFIPEFIDENNNKFGPISVNQVVNLPLDICNTILVPKGYVEYV